MPLDFENFQSNCYDNYIFTPLFNYCNVYFNHHFKIIL